MRSWKRATRSRRYRNLNVYGIGLPVAVFDFFRDDSKGQRLDLPYSLFPSVAIDRDSGDFGDVRNPAPIHLAVEFDGEIHVLIVPCQSGGPRDRVLALENVTPYFIAIAGGSGSGKSFLTHYLARRLGATVIALDSYYRDLSHLDLAARARQNFDAPESLDWELISSQLEALARGCGVDKPVYSFVTHTRTGQTDRIEPSEFMIVEGLFALYHERVRELCGAKVFLAVPDRTAFERRLERDVRERGRTPESVHAQYEATVRPMYQEHILPTRAFADLALNGEDPAEQLAAAVLAHISKNPKDICPRTDCSPHR